MQHILTRDRSKIFTIDENKIDRYTLFDTFNNTTIKTIYVTRMEEGIDRLIGIITLGDFCRNIRSGGDTPLINTNFKKVSINEEEKSVDILESKKNIMSVPVVDGKGTIIKEYYKNLENTDDDKIAIDIVNKILREADILKSGYDKIIFLVDKISENYTKIGSSIVIKEGLTLYEIENEIKGKNICVCDFVYRNSSVRKEIFKKFGIAYILWDFYDIMEVNQIISDRSSLYKKVGVLNTARYLYKKVFQDESNVCDIDDERLMWNEKYNCYEYKSTNIDVEAIFMMICYKINPYIIINGKLVPIIALKFSENPENESRMACVDIAYNIIPHLEANNVKCIVINNPKNEMREIEEFLDIDISKRKDLWLDKKEAARFICGDSETNNIIVEELFSVFQPFIKNGYAQVKDIQGKYVNFVQGERYTVGNPKNYENTIYMYGPCLVRGGCVEDKYTISSLIREKIDKTYYIKNLANNYITMNYAMRDNKYKSGDIVIIFAYDSKIYEENGIKCDSIISAYKRVPNLERNVWDNLLHCNKIAMKPIAEEICKIINERKNYLNHYINRTEVMFGINNKKISVPVQLRSYLKKVSAFKKKSDGKNGAIVMNCNPFTYGHRYLIEEAKKHVNLLYIFVVEENKSFFEFKDRINMVKIGVEDMNDVVVIPSGKYMISSMTLPGYFEKEENPYAEFDATEDLDIFGGIISKEFDISVRFAGEEPKDAFTRQYNHYMSVILPKHGVQFLEIPRKSLNGEIISASLVRDCIKEENYKKVKTLVPPKVYEYLLKNYFKENFS